MLIALFVIEARVIFMTVNDCNKNKKVWTYIALVNNVEPKKLTGRVQVNQTKKNHKKNLDGIEILFENIVQYLKYVVICLNFFVSQKSAFPNSGSTVKNQ